MSASSLNLYHSRVSSFDYGIHFDATAPHFLRVDCTTLTGNGVGIYVNNLGSGNVTRSNIYENSFAGVQNFGGSTLQAKTNWWGHPNGPTLPNGPTYGDRVIGKVATQQYATSKVVC